MLSAILLGGLLAAGAPAAMVLATAMAVAVPEGSLVLLAAVGFLLRIRARPGTRTDEEVALLHGMAAELRAGSSLRQAFVAGTARAPRLPLDHAVRLMIAGRPVTEAAAEVRRVLPVSGRVTAAGLELAAATGARSADLFARLAAHAAEHGELVRERRALTGTSPAIGAAGGRWAPRAAGGDDAAGGDPARSGAGRFILLVGGTLILAGGAVIWGMIRRAER